jgi:hypothetical protein
VAAGTSMPPRKSPRTGHRCKPSCTCGCREVPHRVQDTLPFVTAVLWLSCLHSPGIPHGVRTSSNSLELFVADLPQVLQVHLQLRAPAADLAQPPGPTGPALGSRSWSPGASGIAGHTKASRRPPTSAAGGCGAGAAPPPASAGGGPAAAAAAIGAAAAAPGCTLRRVPRFGLAGAFRLRLFAAVPSLRLGRPAKWATCDSAISRHTASVAA